MLKLRCLSVLFSITYCAHDSKTHDKLLYTTLNGNNFLSKFPKGMFFKVLNSKENHNGFQYKAGKNEDDLPFNPSGECKSGGLYFTEKTFADMYFKYGDHVRLVKILPDSEIYVEYFKYKTNKLELGKAYTFCEFFETFFTKEELLYILKCDYKNIKYFSEKLITQEILKFLMNLDIVDKFDSIPSFILTRKFCEDSINLYNNFNFIGYIPEKSITISICLNQIKNNAKNFTYIPAKFLTHEMVISCIETNNNCFEYIPENLLSKDVCEYFLAKDYLTYIKFMPNKFLTTTQYNIKQILIYYIKTKRKIFNLFKPEYSYILINNEYEYNIK